MKTTLALPRSLLSEAQRVTGVKTKTQAIVLALNEMIQRRKSKKILELQGSMKQDFDYKFLRKKR